MEKFNILSDLIEKEDIKLITCKSKLFEEINKPVEDWDIIHKLSNEGYNIYNKIKMLEKMRSDTLDFVEKNTNKPNPLIENQGDLSEQSEDE